MDKSIDCINPAGTDGFEFVEFASPNPRALVEFFTALGFVAVSRHPILNITRFQQGDINFLLTENTNFSKQFKSLHGPCVCSFGLRVKSAKKALQHLLVLGADIVEDPARDGLPVPAIKGVGGSRLYLVDQYGEKGSVYDTFIPLLDEDITVPSALATLDHLTHNVHRGQLDVWAGFYERLFNFRAIRYFDISGEYTGLLSRAMTAPCGKARIPINESSDDKSQIAEYLEQYNGEGIQHIALSTEDIYQTIETLKKNGVPFMMPPPDTYYNMLDERLPDHGEDVQRMQKNGILMDGSDNKHLLLQIFTEPSVGPIFFEIIQRKGDDGFGEGNFKALFESMERDQIRRGTLQAD